MPRESPYEISLSSTEERELGKRAAKYTLLPTSWCVLKLGVYLTSRSPITPYRYRVSEPLADFFQITQHRLPSPSIGAGNEH